MMVVSKFIIELAIIFIIEWFIIILIISIITLSIRFIIEYISEILL